MFRKITALVAVALVVACVSAKEYKGTVTKIDSDKKTMTVKVGDDEKVFGYSDKTEFVRGKGDKAKTISTEQLTKMAEKLGEKGAPATITTEEKDDKEVVKDGHPVASKVSFGGKRQK